MNAQEDTFISHLVELRDRLLRAVAAVIVVFVCLMPWAGDIYDILAHPMMQALPEAPDDRHGRGDALLCAA